MRMKYISKIQGNLSRYNVIHTNRISSNVLDGSYASVFKGKSMNFDELREYVMGDEIKDIDWKASSRCGRVLVRQYIAEKKHNVMFVFDTNRRMLAESEDGTEKQELGIMAAGTLALYVNRNNDYVGCTYSTEDSFKHFPFKSGLGNIEMILESYNKAVTLDNHSDINKSLDYIARNYKRNMVIVIVSDVEGIMHISDTNLRRLKVSNDILFINVCDADLKDGVQFDLGSDEYVDEFFANDKHLRKLMEDRRLELEQKCEDRLSRYGIACARISGMNGIEREVTAMLSKHKLEKK